jgi:lysylphosphatidylglycerol synthase-like protein
MTSPNPANSRTVTKDRRQFASFGIIFGLLGTLLFIYFVRRAGLTEVLAGIRRLGFGFLLILAISSIRHTVRALAWTLCVEAPYKLRFRDAFAARLMGDALGNLIPLASVAVSEPSKAVFVRDRLPLVIAVSGLAIENIFYSLSVAAFIFSGTLTLLLNFSVPRALSYAGQVTLVISVLVIAFVAFLLRKQWRFASGTIKLLSKKGTRGWFVRMLPRAMTFEDRLYGFYARGRKNFLAILVLEAVFHLAGVAEIFTTLTFISVVPPTLLSAFILESVNRVINISFKFVPLRTGVDEAGTGMLAKVIGFATATGVTLAIIRKGRDIFWAGIGVLLMLRRGLSIRSVQASQLEEAAEASEQAPASN